ncbi:MAG: Fic family protein, partial [Acidimicrobiia bacterium]
MDDNQVSHMLFAMPTLGEPELQVLTQIDVLRKQLRHQTYEPRRWVGSLRRLSLARALQGSNSIEGFDAALDDAAAVAMGEMPLDADEETRLALQGYRDAMTYVLQLADESDFEYSKRLFKSLHFIMTNYSLDNRPGLWRKGHIYIRREETGEVLYEGADIDLVPGLMETLADALNQPDDAPPLVRAGMAHLNLVMVHPFTDGNGRMARCLQSLILAREGMPLSPVFLSIEEYLGRNTQDYYRVLSEVGGGEWSPDRDATAWVRFTLTAHLHQARTMLRRIRESEQLWARLEALTKEHGLGERSLVGLFDAALGFRIRSATYRAAFAEMGEPVTEGTATRDLRLMVESGLLIAHGEKRGRYYVAAEPLKEVRRAVVEGRDPDEFVDPFAAKKNLPNRLTRVWNLSVAHGSVANICS